MDIDLDLLKNACNMVCRRTDSPDLFDDMQSEVYLAVYEGKYENSKQGIVSCAWKFYRESAKHFHIGFDDIAIYSDDDVRLVNNGSSVYGNEAITRKVGRIGKINSRSGAKFNSKLVESVYEMRADGLYYREIGEILKITKVWAWKQIGNTLHLPIVSTKIKLAAIEGGKVCQKRTIESKKHRETGFLIGSKNINAKLNSQKVIQMRSCYANGESISSLANKFRVSRTVASLAINKKTWKHVDV